MEDPSGQAWLLATTEIEAADGRIITNKAYKGTRICDVDPNSECCHSCGSQLADGCPQGVDATGEPLTLNGIPLGGGCDPTRYSTTNELNGEPGDDALSLRCFDQKRRFGVGFLYPIERYVNALTQVEICPFADDLDPATCRANGDEVSPNPLFTDFTHPDRRQIDPTARPIPPRTRDQVVFAGIVGAPWQDLVLDPSASPLTFRKPEDPVDPARSIDWRLLLPTAGEPARDPLMREQLPPRSGVHPVTGETIGRESTNSINTTEWNIQTKDALQYACTFPLAEPVGCLSYTAMEEALDTGRVVPRCECTYYGDEEFAHPPVQRPPAHRRRRYAEHPPSRGTA